MGRRVGHLQRLDRLVGVSRGVSLLGVVTS